MTGTLTDLEIEGLERTDANEMDFIAHYKSDDGIVVYVFDVRTADSRNAYWIRAFDDENCETLRSDGNIPDCGDTSLDNVVEMVKQQVFDARLQRGKTMEEASENLGIAL